jgi:predicted ATPase/two-component sensor histidine kinase/GAF domain-containing protein
MIPLTQRTLEALWEDEQLVLYRAALDGGDRVLVQVAVSDTGAAQSVGRLEHALALREHLDPAWAARPRALIDHHGRPALLVEDPGGRVLAELDRPWSVPAFLRAAIAIASALGQLHDRGLVHKDIKPGNILVDVAAGAAWLTGFGIASRVPRERHGLGAPEVIAGTLAYMAPEQTGRMNRSIDSRSDLYSLGVTLYEMLSGGLPFTAAEPIEWIHCHVAREPVPLAPAVPAALAAIVMKLLAKTAEDRYQTAAGLAADLRRCLAEWEARGDIAPFATGSRDASRRLLVPETLYGRAAEIAALLAAFERVVSTGAPALVLVAGVPGVGKSALVSELHKVLVPSRGLFAAGKFDQFRRDVPYATLAQAFQGLVRQILGETDAEVARWRRLLGDALGASGQLAVALVPELELVVGPQPPLAELPPHDAQKRFQVLLRRLLGVFARREHPLVLFLDDLQWLDGATLELLHGLLVEDDVRHLLLVGAYRDNEVGPDHGLSRALGQVRRSGADVRELVLAPLTLADVGQLVGDALRWDPARAAALARQVHDKTGGNPFFAVQFLAALADEGLLDFDPGTARWSADLAGIAARDVTDDVVGLMVETLIRLPAPAQDAVQRLACLGSEVAVPTLAAAVGGDDDALHAALWAAVKAGLVLRRDGAYGFLHDRVQEAAYALIPHDERAGFHLAIGRRLLAHLPARRQADAIFDIASQFQRATALVTAPGERLQVATIDLAAARRARDATAYASALVYLDEADRMLGEAGWREQPAVAFAIGFLRAECELLSGDLDAADERLRGLAGRAASRVDEAAVARLRMQLYTMVGRSDRAVDVCLDYLRGVGIDWVAHPDDRAVEIEMSAMWRRIGDRPIEALLDLPAMTDPEQRATMDVLTTVQPPALFTDQNLHSLVVGRLTRLSLDHGNSDGSCYAYAVLGVVLGAHMGDYPAAYRFGKLGFDLVEQRGLTRFKARAYLSFGAHVNAWARHVRTSLELVRRAHAAAHETGDLTFAAYSAETLVTFLLAAGAPLAEVQRAAARGLAFARRMRFGLVVDIITGQLRLIETLRGTTPILGSFDDGAFSEAGFEQHFAAAPQLAFAACWYWIRKLEARYHGGDPAAALAAAAEAARLLWTSPGHFEVAEYHLYTALAHAALHDQVLADQRAGHRDAVAGLHRQLAVWASHGPDNFACRAALVGAELARIDGDELLAMRRYDEAIDGARDHGFVQVEAVAHERAALFYAARGSAAIARLYLRSARAGYLRWGALGKVRQLDRRHPHLDDERPPAATPGTATIARPVGELGLDLTAVVAMSQAVSGEIELDRLIERLLTIAVEHAGAQRGLLILQRGDELRVEAEAIAGHGGVDVRLRQAPVTSADGPETIVRFVARAQRTVILDDALRGEVAADRYLAHRRPRSVLCLPLVKQARLVGVLYLENRLAPGVFTPARGAVLELLASQAAISLENARLFTDLRRAEAYLAEAQRISRTGSFGWTVATGALVWSAESHDIFGVERSVAPTLDVVLARIHPDDRPRVEALLDRVAQAGGDWELETRLALPGGVVKTVRIVAHASRPVPGSLGYVGAVMDVTAARRAEERLQDSLADKDALLKEVHHRVKNNLQLVSSLLSLQASRAGAPAIAELFAESRNRVRSMALVHENLYRAGDFSRIPMATHVQKLCAYLTAAYATAGQRVELAIEVSDLHLDIDRAISCGLVVNELVSNALKHAFPGGRAGTVRVALEPAGGGRHLLTVSDDGVGLPAGLDVGHAGSLGLQLVRDLTDQLGGTLEVGGGRGARFAIVFDAEGRRG